MNPKNLSESDNFNIVKFIYMLLNDSMKYALDMGTLLSDDPQKLRAYKEQIKKNSKGNWDKLGAALVNIGIADDCICSRGEYCQVCGGSRFVMSSLVSSTEIVEHVMAISGSITSEAEKQAVAEGLMSPYKSELAQNDVSQV
jgi:hypothetical protein